MDFVASIRIRELCKQGIHLQCVAISTFSLMDRLCRLSSDRRLKLDSLRKCADSKSLYFNTFHEFTQYSLNCRWIVPCVCIFSNWSDINLRYIRKLIKNSKIIRALAIFEILSLMGFYWRFTYFWKVSAWYLKIINKNMTKKVITK